MLGWKGLSCVSRGKIVEELKLFPCLYIMSADISGSKGGLWTIKAGEDHNAEPTENESIHGGSD